MKKLVVAVMGMLCATALVVHAQDTKPAKKQLTPEQEAVQKEMLAKYDTNKDGKIDKEERKAISKEDRQKMVEAGLIKSKKTANASTNAPAAN